MKRVRKDPISGQLKIEHTLLDIRPVDGQRYGFDVICNKCGTLLVQVGSEDKTARVDPYGALRVAEINATRNPCCDAWIPISL